MGLFPPTPRWIQGHMFPMWASQSSCFAEPRPLIVQNLAHVIPHPPYSWLPREGQDLTFPIPFTQHKMWKTCLFSHLLTQVTFSLHPPSPQTTITWHFHLSKRHKFRKQRVIGSSHGMNIWKWTILHLQPDSTCLRFVEWLAQEEFSPLQTDLLDF